MYFKLWPFQMPHTVYLVVEVMCMYKLASNLTISSRETGVTFMKRFAILKQHAIFSYPFCFHKKPCLSIKPCVLCSLPNPLILRTIIKILHKIAEENQSTSPNIDPMTKFPRIQTFVVKLLMPSILSKD